MAFLDEHKAKFDNLTVSLEHQNRDQLRRKANGGNTILFTFPPDEEAQYIKHAESIFPSEKYMFINLANIFYELSKNWELKKWKEN